MLNLQQIKDLKLYKEMYDDERIELRKINYQYYYDECMKIIDPIKLNISPNLKANANKKTKSGKALIKKYSSSYLTLFDDNDE